MAIDERALRDALGGFCTGVTVVTAQTPEGERLGITVSSFNSVSLDPPLILFSLDLKALSIEGFRAAGSFAINVLSASQEDMCLQFAQPKGDKWAGVDFRYGETGAPILDGCVTTLDCRTYAIYDGGDHLIFVGEVVDIATDAAVQPLLYYRGRFHRL